MDCHLHEVPSSGRKKSHHCDKPAWLLPVLLSWPYGLERKHVISPSCPVSFTAQDWVTAASGPSQKAPPCGRPEAWAGLGSMVRKKVDRWASLSPLVPGKPHSSLGPCSQGHPQSIGLSVRRTLLAMKFVPDIYSFLCPR